MLRTGAFVSIHALGEKKHAHRGLMLSSLIPLIYVPKAREEEGKSQMHFSRQHLREHGRRRTVKLIYQYGSKNLVRIAVGTRNGPLSQCSSQK